MDTIEAVLLRYYYAFVLSILEYCSPVWGQLLNIIFSYSGTRCMHSVARLNADLSFLSLCHRRHMLLDCVCCTRLIRIRIVVCSVNFHLQLWYHFIPWVAAQAVGLSGIPKDARSRLTQCSKSCDLQPSPHCSVQYVELRGFCPVKGGGCDQSIGSTVSDAIVRSWLWLTPTRSSSLGYFSRLLQVVDNWTHILW